MPSPSFRLTIAAAALTLFGCASTSGLAVGDSPVDGANPDVITRAEISATNLGSTAEVIQRLRPRWLRSPRPANSFSDGTAARGPNGADRSGDLNAGPNRVQVFMDGVRIGTIEQLGPIPSTSVERMQWLDGTAAVSRYGTGNDAGVILITSRRG